MYFLRGRGGKCRHVWPCSVISARHTWPLWQDAIYRARSFPVGPGGEHSNLAQHDGQVNDVGRRQMACDWWMLMSSALNCHNLPLRRYTFRRRRGSHRSGFPVCGLRPAKSEGPRAFAGLDGVRTPCPVPRVAPLILKGLRLVAHRATCGPGYFRSDNQFCGMLPIATASGPLTLGSATGSVLRPRSTRKGVWHRLANVRGCFFRATLPHLDLDRQTQQSNCRNGDDAPRIFAIFCLTSFWGIKSCFTPGKSSSAGIGSPLSCPSGGSSGPVGVVGYLTR